MKSLFFSSGSLRPWRPFVLAVVLAATGCAPNEVSVDVRVVDADSGNLIPSRLEVMDSDGQFHIAGNSIPVTLECVLSPLPEWLAPLRSSSSIENPYTGTTQFYADGIAKISLTPGKYRLRIAKGLEWRRVEQELDVKPGQDQVVTIKLKRWVDPTQDGWYGADDHLHITRMHPDENHRIARWMRAEGLQIANLLEMGTANQLSVSPQFAYGDSGAYRDGPLLLLTGEEHPRTHLLGHTITLGTEERVDRRDEYIVYDSTFREGAERGGVSGFAHFGMGHARDGLAISAPTGLVRFVEVLQFELPYYDVWYELLNLGFRIAPSAGTDFPCGPASLPGRERFYAKIPGKVTRESFVEAVRAGRTFTTNGPIINLDVAGTGPGGEIDLPAPGAVSVRGRVRFDPETDRVGAVELIVNGEVVARSAAETSHGLFEIRHDLAVDRSSWVALRSVGTKSADDGPMPSGYPARALKLVQSYGAGGGGPELFDFRTTMTERPSAAHTAAVHINVAGTSTIYGDATLPAAWLERLATLERSISDDHIAEVPILDWIPYSDGVSESHIRRNRPALRRAIALARDYYESVPTENN